MTTIAFSQIRNATEQAMRIFNQVVTETEAKQQKLVEGLEWEVQQVRDTNRSLSARLEDFEAKTKDMVTAQDCVDQVNAVHQEYVEKLAQANREMEGLRAALQEHLHGRIADDWCNSNNEETIKSLVQLREADQARIGQLEKELELTRSEVNQANGEASSWARECNAANNRANKNARFERLYKKYKRRYQAQVGRTQGTGKSTKVAGLQVALEVLANENSQLEAKLDARTAEVNALNEDYAKLHQENERVQRMYEDLFKNHKIVTEGNEQYHRKVRELEHVNKSFGEAYTKLRAAVLGYTKLVDGRLSNSDRYSMIAESTGVPRDEVKRAMLSFSLEKLAELENKIELLGDNYKRVTHDEMLHQFKNEAFVLLRCVMQLTAPAISALQYGSHSGHRMLHKCIVDLNRKFPQGRMHDSEVLR